MSAVIFGSLIKKKFDNSAKGKSESEPKANISV